MFLPCPVCVAAYHSRLSRSFKTSRFLRLRFGLRPPLARRGKIVVVVVVVVFPFGRPTNRLVLNLWVQTLRALYESQSVVVVVVTTRHNTRDSLSLFLFSIGPSVRILRAGYSWTGKHRAVALGGVVVPRSVSNMDFYIN